MNHQFKVLKKPNIKKKLIQIYLDNQYQNIKMYLIKYYLHLHINKKMDCYNLMNDIFIYLFILIYFILKK